MNLRRLGRILWGHRILVLTPTVCTLLGGLWVILTFPPRYEATTRVMLDIVKPDPVTGFRVGDKMRDAYLSSQLNMLRDDQVTGRVVETMGWLENPDMVAAWQSAPDKGDDFKRWAGRRVAFGIGGDIVPDTNILEIRYQSTAPDLARLVADNIRTSYVEATIEQTRDTARANSTNLSAQAERERERLVELQMVKANLERETGIMLSDSGATTDAQRALVAARALPKAEMGKIVTKDNTDAMRAQLQNIDSSIIAASRTLGPNNPVMMEMHRRRDLLAAQVAGVKTPDPVANQTMRRLDTITALARQSADRIYSVSDKTLALRLIQDEIKRRRALFDKVAQRSGEQLEISNVSDANLTPLGQTTVKPAPVFPNFALIVGGTGVLGFMLGALLAFVVEALSRRVRGVEDVRGAIEAPLLGVMPSITWPKAPRPRVEKSKEPKKPRVPKAERKAKLARA